ncbi:related to EXG1 - exo-beta-1,3-glucanase (I/II), major isoform [Melanopsichium pennsylvanicum]|uniref:glucan 1,3-beta-glucosidase n=2 Tax=Melanopsichium pennsylvanicum TaxID=63383 RepID=A0AAJ4XSD0_9BASI|nr:related to EXG1-exo-beta-1,3-glucanase (I/II), major isoform [Melanopsichium pennsylvanicum 4]SNX87453.1 related to EXG1 - exo-beta-1,3-glucanase (I/II), major isoform [Melanopsichium pennsylvanicum]
MPGRRPNSLDAADSYELPKSPPQAAVEQPLLNTDNSFATDPDDTGDTSLQQFSHPSWTRSGSRYSPEEHSRDPDLDRPFASSSSAYRQDRTSSPGHPTLSPERPFTPPFGSYASRPVSLASTHMLSVRSQSDYDSVYQLWRQSGTPSSFKDFAGDDAASGYYDTRRSSTAQDLEKIAQYRAGAYDPHSPQLHADQGLHEGKAGAKGPKDYRAVGLAKYGRGKDQQMSTKKKWLIVAAVAAVVGVLVIAIVVPITQILLKDKSTRGNSSSPSSGSNDSGPGQTPVPEKNLAIWGTNGSTIDLGNGKNFTYVNDFGGRWASQPLNNSAQAQNYTPPLDQEFNFATNRILGVNLGGWLVTEPFIVPALYEAYENTSNPAVDEFTLSQRYRSEGGEANLRSKMIEHYDTFITEQDFANIAGAGLNWVRLPIGFWALETYLNEPYLEGVAWTYVLKAIQWARKYGLRINLDLHAVPGSQNAYNHSGRIGWVNFLQGLMGKANGERTMDYIRQITQFISQPEIGNVVPMLSVINEPYAISIGQPALQSWYSQLYTTLRAISGTGAGNGPYITIHDGFLPLSNWQGFLSGGDRIAWDTHPYICFGQQNTDAWDVQILKPCNQFTPLLDNARSNMGVAMGGEMSLAINDCGLFLNGVGAGSRYDGSYSGPVAGNYPRMGSCQPFDDYENYSSEMKQGLRRFALTSMDSLQDFFFWTWKIGNSLRTGKPSAPMWSYSLGLQQGWMPTNPLSDSSGACQAQASRLSSSVPTATWGRAFQSWQTGQASSYSPNTAQYPWPPASIVPSNTPIPQSANLAASALPSYTATQSFTPVPAPTFSATASVVGQPTAVPTVGNWYNTEQSQPFYTAIEGCNYPNDQYNLTGWNPSGWPCSGGGDGQRKREIIAQPTPIP